MTQNLNAMDVIEFLAQGQNQIRQEIINYAKSYWEPDQEGPAFFAFNIELGSNPDKVDWKSLFTAIEIVLQNPAYCDYSSQVKTHILEGLSNRVANGDLAPEVLTTNAGPLAREHMKNWELMMSNKTIF